MTVRTNSDFDELGGRDPYAVLGLPRGASAEAVTQAFRRSAQGIHPDIGGDAGAFRRLTRARDVLLDPDRLAAYDAARRSAGAGDTGRQYTGRQYMGGRYMGGGGTSRGGSATATPGRGHSEATTRRAGTATQEAPSQPRQSPVPSDGARTNPWAVLTVVLALLGPLLWPVALATAALALLHMKRSGDRGNRRGSSAAVLLYGLAVLVLPLLTVVIVTVI